MVKSTSYLVASIVMQSVCRRGVLRLVAPIVGIEVRLRGIIRSDEEQRVRRQVESVMIVLDSVQVRHE